MYFDHIHLYSPYLVPLSLLFLQLSFSTFIFERQKVWETFIFHKDIHKSKIVGYMYNFTRAFKWPIGYTKHPTAMMTKRNMGKKGFIWLTFPHHSLLLKEAQTGTQTGKELRRKS